MEARSTVAVTDDDSGSAAVTISPSKLVKRPRTLLTMRCRTVKDTSECTGSIAQEPATQPGNSVVRVLVIGILQMVHGQ